MSLLHELEKSFVLNHLKNKKILTEDEKEEMTLLEKHFDEMDYKLYGAKK